MRQASSARSPFFVDIAMPTNKIGNAYPPIPQFPVPGGAIAYGKELLITLLGFRVVFPAAPDKGRRSSHKVAGWWQANQVLLVPPIPLLTVMVNKNRTLS
jgi:hypothetical protein